MSSSSPRSARPSEASRALAATPAHELGRIAIEAALEQAGVAGEDVSEVILGQVLTAAQGQNPARQASMAAGVPKEVPAWGVNQVCGSGLRAVALAAQAIQPVMRRSSSLAGDTVVEDDEYIRAGATVDSVAGLRPAFKKDGTVTAANASGINDGAAALVLMRRDEAERRGAPVLATVRSWAFGGRRPFGDGHRPRPRQQARAGKGRLDARRPRPDRGERGVRGAGAVGRQGTRLGRRPGQRQRRRDRDRPPDRRERRPRADDADLRNEQARRRKGAGDAVHRRRHGNRDVRGNRVILFRPICEIHSLTAI
ncbi:hypothetical protein L7F22_068906 [Adiantum nelumboides]|nr:hypothetical protein [Adiantum nelumboides]